MEKIAAEGMEAFITAIQQAADQLRDGNAQGAFSLANTAIVSYQTATQPVLKSLKARQNMRANSRSGMETSDDSDRVSAVQSALIA